jgi:hypothetical protein
MNIEAADQISEARKNRVKELTDEVKADLKHWDYAFTRMANWRRFGRGMQWPGTTKSELSDADRKYVANVTMRHLKQRTAAIYAKNPTFTFTKTKRLNSRNWDGTAQQLMMAQQSIAMGEDVTGSAMAIVTDAINARAQSTLNARVGDTTALLYQYFVREQTPPTKMMMKKQVQASLTAGVAYIKQTFQRAMDYPPDTQRALADSLSQLALLDRLSKEMAEGDIAETDAKAEQLRVVVKQLEETEKIVLREGLALDYPNSRNIIPDRNLTYLPGFVGCGRVTEQYCLTRDQILEVYKVDVKDQATSYTSRIGNETAKGASDETTHRVWEIWDRLEGTVYTICDGYPDYLEEPHEPITYTERFWPWFVYAPNAVDDDEDPFPPSDVELMMTQQMEINRAGEGLRDHRFAARPGHVTSRNLDSQDGERIKNRKAHDVIVLKGVNEGEKVSDVFQEFPTVGIDPNLYETGPAFQDILRSVGTQEANLGGTSGSTATEAGIAESSRQSTTDSAIDEFDDLLTDMARAGGQILIQQMSKQKVVEIVGEGAVWPEMAATREQIAKEIMLKAVAGSSGRPNQAQQVQVRERIYPILVQIPGIKHEKMAQDLVRVLDDSIDYEDWIDMDALPVVAMNGQMQAAANRGGASNAPAPTGPSATGPAKPGQNGAGPIPIAPPA